jgi:hypothetical protein
MYCLEHLFDLGSLASVYILKTVLCFEFRIKQFEYPHSIYVLPRVVSYVANN